ncbi:MAG TPA: hypothetical protein VF092_06610 [Longimicrobium sp.]
MRVLLALLLLLAAVPLRAQAIPADSLPVGRRVRVTVPELYGERVSGHVWELTRDTLVIGDKEGWSRRTIPLSGISRIDVSQGRTNGAVFGGLIGGAIFGGVRYVLAGVGDETVDKAQRNVLLAGAVGALLGAVAGASVSESWRRIYPPR